jgi:general secretion pathway protein L
MIYLKNSIGIELRGEDMVVTCLSSNFSGEVFTHFKRVAGYRTRERAEVRAELEQFFRTRRLGRDNVVLGLPRGDALIRHLDLPREVQDNLEQVVLYQVQSLEPSEDEKFYHDYVLLRSKPEDKRLRVLLVMIKKAILDGHLGLVRELGISPVGVTLGSVALANLFFHARSDADGKTFVLADLKPGRLEVLALRDGALAYTREVSRPEEKSWKACVLEELEVAAAKTHLEPEETIEELVLAGEGTGEAFPELRESIEECRRLASQVRFEMVDGLRSHLDEAAASLGLAYCGIARRLPLELNLLPGELRAQQTRWAYVPSIVLGLAIAVLAAGFAFRATIQEQIMARKLEAEIAGMKVPLDRVRRLKGDVDALEKKIRYVEGICRQKDLNLEILRELTALLPPDTFLNLYSNTEGTIQLSGSSGSAPELIPKIEGSPLLKNVQQRSPIFRDAQTGKDRFSFEAKVER